MKKIDVTMVAIAIRTVIAIRGDFEDRTDADPDLDSLGAASRSAVASLEDFGFSVRDDYRGFSLAFGGIRSTCTAGVGGAMWNWLRKAEKAVDAA